MVTVAEKLNLKPGDVVRYHNITVERYRDYVVEEGCKYATSKDGTSRISLAYPWEGDYKLFRPEKISEDRTPFGELPLDARMSMLRSWQEGEVIEYLTASDTWRTTDSPAWSKRWIYRVKPKPVKQQRVLRDGPVQISYDLIDWKPDPSSVKLEVVG